MADIRTVQIEIIETHYVKAALDVDFDEVREFQRDVGVDPDTEEIDAEVVKDFLDAGDEGDWVPHLRSKSESGSTETRLEEVVL